MHFKKPKCLAMYFAFYMKTWGSPYESSESIHTIIIHSLLSISNFTFLSLSLGIVEGNDENSDTNSSGFIFCIFLTISVSMVDFHSIIWGKWNGGVCVHVCVGRGVGGRGGGGGVKCSPEDESSGWDSSDDVSHIDNFLIKCLSAYSPLLSESTFVWQAMHFLFSQHCFNIPLPPNFGLSKQNRHFPQSFEVHPSHLPHRLRLWDSTRLSETNMVIRITCS